MFAAPCPPGGSQHSSMFFFLQIMLYEFLVLLALLGAEQTHQQILRHEYVMTVGLLGAAKIHHNLT